MKNFSELLEEVVLAQNPNLYMFAVRAHKGLIDEVKFVYKEVYKDSPLYPQCGPNERIIKTSDGKVRDVNPSYVYVKAEVVKHDIIGNRVLLSDEKWHSLNECRTEPSSSSYRIETVAKMELAEQAEDNPF